MKTLEEEALEYDAQLRAKQEEIKANNAKNLLPEKEIRKRHKPVTFLTGTDVKIGFSPHNPRLLFLQFTLSGVVHKVAIPIANFSNNEKEVWDEKHQVDQ